MESGFGTSFRDVLIHNDSHAAASAKALGANAYTSGRDIYFAAGKYAPENDEGKRLLAHELVHTIQQRANTPSFARKRASTSDLIIDPDDLLEQDADRVAEQVVLSASGKMGSDPIAHELAHVAQQNGGGGAVQRKTVEGATPGAQTSLAAPENQTPISGQSGGRTVPNVAPPSTKAAAPAPSAPYPPFYWGHFAPRGEPVAVARAGATLEGIAEFLYGTSVAALDLASINKLELSKQLGAGVVVYPTGGPLTETASRSLASARLLPAGCGDPDLFVARKKLLDAFLQVDFNSIVGWIDDILPLALAAGFSPGSGPLPIIFRKWGEEKFTEYPWAYPNGGDYLDRLFLKLSNKTKILSGILTDEWTNYYSILFNHFDPFNQIAAIRDRTSAVFRGDSGIPELSFASMFWEDVKSGRVRDRIFAGGRGIAKGVWSGLEGTVKFVYTVITDPGQAWEDVKKMPGAVKSLWEHRSELWDQFVNASPEEQAEMIGKLFGEIEFAIASGGAGSLASKGVAKLGQLPGITGRVAKMVNAVQNIPSRVLRGGARVAKTALFKGLKFAVEGATWAAEGVFRLGSKILRGTWSVIEETVGAVTTRLYYFYDETAGVLHQIEERIASWFVKCKSPCELDDLPAITKERHEPGYARQVEKRYLKESQKEWEKLGKGRKEDPALFARHEQNFNSLGKTLENKRAALAKAGRQNLLPEVKAEVLEYPVDFFIEQKGSAELKKAWRELMALAKTDHGLAKRLSKEFGVGREGIGAGTVGSRRPDIVEFYLDIGEIVVTDITTDVVGKVHSFKTKFYREVLESMVGPNGPKVYGLDINPKEPLVSIVHD